MNKAHLEYCAGQEWAETVRKYVVPGATAGIDLGDHLLEVGPGPGLTTDVLATRIAPGPGRDKAVADNRATPTPRSEAKSGQFAGFKIIDYEPTRAIVSIAVRFDERTTAALPVTMVWDGKDWKGKLQADGSFNGSTEPDLLGSLESYVGFQGA